MTMKILRTRKLKCKAVSFSIEAEENEINAILVEGLRRLIKELGLKLNVYPINEQTFDESNDIKSYNLTDEEEQYLLNVGFSSIICDNLKIEFPSIDTFEKLPATRRRKVGLKSA